MSIKNELAAILAMCPSVPVGLKSITNNNLAFEAYVLAHTLRAIANGGKFQVIAMDSAGDPLNIGDQFRFRTKQAPYECTPKGGTCYFLLS